jgi:hypothetical protein
MELNDYKAGRPANLLQIQRSKYSSHFVNYLSADLSAIFVEDYVDFHRFFLLIKKRIFFIYGPNLR